MSLRSTLFLALLFTACDPKPAEDSGAQADDTGSAVDDTGSTGDDTGSTGDDTGSVVDYSQAQVSDVTTRLNDAHENLLYVAWEQGAAATVYVEFQLDGAWRSTPPVEASAGPQEHLLLGIPYGTEVTYRIVNDFGAASIDGQPVASDEATATTGDAPAGLVAPTVIASEVSGQDPDMPYMLATITGLGWGAPTWTTIIDRAGRVVWAYETVGSFTTLYSQTSYDGSDILVDHNSFWGGAWDIGASSEVIRLKIDGTLVATHATPGLHHPFTELPDGSLIWGAAVGYYDEETLERLHPDGTQETVWSCQDHLDSLGVNSYCGSNTLFWSDLTGTVTYSFYSLETVFEIDLDAGEPLRWFGHIPGSWQFDPIESTFWWQHGAHFTADGTLMVSTKVADNAQETATREYQLDAESETLTEVWSFGVGEGLYGSTGGEAQRSPNGNTLHNYGDLTRLREITPAGEVVWDVEWSGEWIGRMSVISDLYSLAP